MEPAKHIRVELRGQLVAETANGFTVHEKGLPDRYYIPRADVTAELRAGSSEGVCPWKGSWRYFDVVVGETHIANGAWTYYETKPVTDRMRDFVAFYETKFSIDVS